VKQSAPTFNHKAILRVCEAERMPAKSY